MSEVKTTDEVAVVDQKTNGKKRSVAKTKKTLANITIQMVLYEAVQRGMDAAALEKLVGLQERLDAKEAEKTFNVAFSKFQGKIKLVVGTKDGSKTRDGVVAFKYAPLEQIMEEIRAPLAEFGLSVSFDSKLTEKVRKTICTITHVDGHSRTSAFESVRSDGTPLMSNLQKESSTDSHLKRYALKNALNIVTEGEDDENAISATSEKKADGDSNLITKNNVKKIVAMVGKSAILRQLILDKYGVALFDQIEKKNFNECILIVEKWKAANK